MLATEDLDILTVATSDHLHAGIVVAGARSGVKGVFCEKPIATTLEDADAMIAACEDEGVKMSIDHTRRWSPLFHKVRDTIRAGTIGPITSITAVLGGPRAMLFRNGTHLIDAICFFAESRPTRVSALLEDGFDHWDRYRGDGGKLPENEPGATGLKLFENGIRALYRGTKGTSPLSALELAGPKGQISFASDDRSAELTIEGEGAFDLVRTPLQPGYYQVHGLVAAYEELVDIIERGGESISAPRDARTALQIMLGFLDSHQQDSRLVEVPN
jgi:predicted dehydrogenase